MKKGYASQKVPQGKLLQMEVTCDGGTVQEVNITGDFFLHPEDAIFDLEGSLKGLSIDTDVQDIIDRLRIVMKAKNMLFVGITPQDIAGTLLQAIAQCRV
jgi:lipoate-protein ligase A